MRTQQGSGERSSFGAAKIPLEVSMTRRRAAFTLVLGSFLLMIISTAFGSSFKAAGNYPVGDHPVSIAAGDFNGDGKIDLAVSNSGSKTFSLLLGNGDGTFQPQMEMDERLAPPELVESMGLERSYRSGMQTSSVVFADFNGDGQLDQAVTLSGRNIVSVLLNVTDERQPAINLITNGGFETGSLSPWAQGRDFCSSPCQNWTVVTNNPRQGKYDAMDEGNIEVVQDFTATATSLITGVRLSLRHPAGAVTTAIDFFYSDGSDEEFVVATTTTKWDSFNVTSDLASGKSLDGFSIWGYSGGTTNTPITFADSVGITAN
jgi:hypothetical protein